MMRAGSRGGVEVSGGLRLHPRQVGHHRSRWIRLQLRKWWPRTSPRWPRSRTRWAPPDDDGLGLRMGLSVGATARHGSTFVTAPIYPPASMVMGVIVNKNGDRFVTDSTIPGHRHS